MPFQIISGDITKQICDAIVNPTDVAYSGSGGTDRAIHRAAGAQLRAACDRLPALQWGESRLTRGYALPAGWIIHTAGPVWTDGAHREAEILAGCYRSALELAAENDFRSVAFPLIAAGTCGFPRETALSIAIEQIRRFLKTHEIDVMLVVHDRQFYRIDPRTEADVERYLRTHLRRWGFPRANRIGKADTEDLSQGAAFELRAEREPSASRPQMLPTAPAAYSHAPAPSLADRLEAMDESFSDTVLRLIDERGMTDAQCYKRANVSKQVFSKLRSSSDYRPSKNTALAIAVALELDLEETRALLEKAGMSLSRSLKADVIVEYFISSRRFDIMEINETLYRYDQALLGAK